MPPAAAGPPSTAPQIETFPLPPAAAGPPIRRIADRDVSVAAGCGGTPIHRPADRDVSVDSGCGGPPIRPEVGARRRPPTQFRGVALPTEQAGRNFWTMVTPNDPRLVG